MKGQYFSFDAIVASVIFVLALVALLSYWHSMKSFLDHQSDDLAREAVRISNLLLTPAYPQGSCDDGMSSAGLGISWQERSRISVQALACLEGRDSGWLQERLGTPHKVYALITRIDGSGTKTSFGTEPGEDATNVMKLRRLATLVDEQSGATTLVTMDIQVYS